MYLGDYVTYMFLCIVFTLILIMVFSALYFMHLTGDDYSCNNLKNFNTFL